MRPMIMFSNVNKWYSEYQALTNLTAQVNTGEVVVLCGPSGSGKSTLIRTVNRLEDIQKGQILFDGQDVNGTDANVNRLRSRVGFVFQSFNWSRTCRCWTTSFCRRPYGPFFGDE